MTNLNKKYNSEQILNLYRNRWDVEIFFKLVKANFKFDFIKSSDKIDNKKNYICIQILIYLCKIIELAYLQSHKQTSKIGFVKKINKSDLIEGIIDTLLELLLNNQLTEKEMDNFCATYIHFYTNAENRHFCRNSKLVFSKWYIKGYSIRAEIKKNIKAIEIGTIHTLNDNLKSKARQIISI